MVLAAHLGTLYPGAQLDSGLRHVDVATAADLDMLLLPGSGQSLCPHRAVPALVVMVLEWTGMAQGGGGWVPCSQVWGWLCLVCGLVLQPALTGSCLQWGLGLPCSR